VKGVFAKLRVIEISGDIAGAHLGQICTDRGAEVIKIEPPGGDVLRQLGSHSVSESKLFQAMNRGKQSVILDVSDVQQQEKLLLLVHTADILILSSPVSERPKSLYWEKLKDNNPALIVVDITPFGAAGPWSERPANDLVIQAYGGTLLSEGKTADDGSTPLPLTSTKMSEHGTALTAAIGLGSALFHRARTGKGQKVSVAKLLTVLAMQSARVVINPPADKSTEAGKQAMLMARAQQQPIPEIKNARQLNSNRVVNLFYRPYQTRDGAVFVGALTRGLRDKARAALGTHYLGRDDPDFDPLDDAQIDQALEHQAAVETRIKEESTAYWIARLERAGVPTGEVLFPEDLAEEPQLLENYYMCPVSHEVDGEQMHVAPHVQFSLFPDPDLAGAPSLGRDTDKWLNP